MSDETPQPRLGFKTIGPENWLKIDPAWGGIVMSSSHPDPAIAWIVDIMAPRLPAYAPDTVVRLFEAARGTLVYALFFYPMLTHGLDLLMRVLETAAAERCAALGAPPGVGRFSRMVGWLIARDAIPADEHERWRLAVLLRNEAAHPTDQSIYSPGMALSQLDFVVELIEALYSFQTSR